MDKNEVGFEVFTKMDIFWAVPHYTALQTQTIVKTKIIM